MIEKILEDYVNLFEDTWGKYIVGKKPETLYKPIEDLLRRGGKRLRPTLCLMSYELFDEDIRKAMPTALSLEFFHNFSLVHDDIEDGSELRRGEKTLHIKYGVPIAINAGDGLFALCYDVLRENERAIGKERAWEIFKRVARMSIEIAEGQAMDLEFKARRNMDEGGVIELLKRKTGVLFGTSAECGAIAGGASYEVAKELKDAWENIGIAFQIRDDILNIIGEEEKYGKRIGEDIAEGKPSLLLIHCLENCNEREKEEIYESFLNYEKTKIEKVIDMFRKYGSIEYSKAVAEKYLSMGIDKIRRIEGREEIKERMIELAEYFVMREK
ncbi:MAG: polyprenyl synthetase family protein [Candidatus Methanospirareceae archaeon]